MNGDHHLRTTGLMAGRRSSSALQASRCRSLLACGFYLLLSACSSTPHAVCPPLKEYPESFSNRLANEIELMPADSATVEAIGDYIALRDSVRACQ